jgi:hypothetical protein
MANTGQKNSNGSQFFLNVANNANLDWFTGGASKHPVRRHAAAVVQAPERSPVAPLRASSLAPRPRSPARTTVVPFRRARGGRSPAGATRGAREAARVCRRPTAGVSLISARHAVSSRLGRGRRRAPLAAALTAV